MYWDDKGYTEAEKIEDVMIDAVALLKLVRKSLILNSRIDIVLERAA